MMSKEEFVNAERLYQKSLSDWKSLDRSSSRMDVAFLVIGVVAFVAAIFYIFADG